MTIDLRSDTVTKPTPGMRAAMASAEVGDDVFGEDPTVNRLERMAAELLGKEAALFCATGTQGNLLALLSHCGRGDEYIAGQRAHIYRHEGGGAAVVASVQPQPIELERDGTLDLSRVAQAIKPDDFHFARTRLICLENTQDGKVLPLRYLREVRDFAQRRGLRTHLDGARLFNAAVALDVEAAEIARHFDSVAVCLSKGLGAPAGSLLCGSAEWLHEARRWRKVLGGGMRQAGVLAAAGIYALEHHVRRLAQDHSNASVLAERLAEIRGLTVADCQTNMVFVETSNAASARLRDFLRQRGVLIKGEGRTRLVTHLDVDREDVLEAADAFRAFFAGPKASR